MGVKRWFLILLCAGTLLSCGVVGRLATPRSPDPKKAENAATAHYSDATLATYYYTEGLKTVIMNGPQDQAKKLFEQVLKIDSTHAPTYYELANLIQDEPEQALKYSLKAFRLDSTNLWYKEQLGHMLIQAEQYDSALVVYSDLVRTAPDNPDHYRLLAALHEIREQPFAALIMLDSAENKFGRIEQLSQFKRRLLVKVKLFDKALEEARAIVDDYPYDEANYVALASLYAITRQDSLALDAYDKALAIDPDNIETLIAANEYYKMRNDDTNFFATARRIMASDQLDLETKIRYFEEITASTNFYRNNYFQITTMASALTLKYPRDFKVADIYAGHLIRGGSMEEGLNIYKSFVGDTVQNQAVFSNIIDIEAYLNRPDSLAKYAAMAVKLFPEDPMLYIRKGSILSYLKKYEEADVAFKGALKLAKTDSLTSVIYGYLGDNSYNLKSLKTTFRYYDKGLKRDSTNAMIYNNYSYFLAENDGDLKKAEHYALQATRLLPNNPTFLDTHAWVLYKQGRYQEAQNIMRLAVSLDSSNNSELFLHYGDILYALGDDFMARVYWRKALEKEQDQDKKEEIEKRLKQIEKK